MQKSEPLIDAAIGSEQIRFLAEVGFLAAGRKEHQMRAERIFRALLVLRPEQDFPYLGLGLTFLNSGQILDAILILERGRLIVPDSIELSVFLAMALRAAQRNGEAAKLLTELLAVHKEDLPILHIARHMLAA